jgi:hypothetical protein
VSEEETMWERSIFFLDDSDLADDGDDAAGHSVPTEVRLGPDRRRGRHSGPRRHRRREGRDLRGRGGGLRVPVRLRARGCRRRPDLGLGVQVRRFRGMAAGRNLARDRDVVAGRDITGGGEEEILGEVV